MNQWNEKFKSATDAAYAGVQEKSPYSLGNLDVGALQGRDRSEIEAEFDSVAKCALGLEVAVHELLECIKPICKSGAINSTDGKVAAEPEPVMSGLRSRLVNVRRGLEATTRRIAEARRTIEL